jgi:hypothetical protein
MNNSVGKFRVVEAVVALVFIVKHKIHLRKKFNKNFYLH